VRGTIALVEMMFLGMRYLNWSAQVAWKIRNAAADRRHRSRTQSLNGAAA
jgi:hypothetical protein